jgi:hypothetical protein
MENSEKLATYGTQDQEKQNKNTRRYVLNTSYKQLEVNYISMFWLDFYNFFFYYPVINKLLQTN